MSEYDVTTQVPEQEIADILVDGTAVASVSLTTAGDIAYHDTDVVRISVFDPNNPEDSIEEFRFPLPQDDQ